MDEASGIGIELGRLEHEGGADAFEGERLCGLELELGGLVAALSASTEDETELALRVRALVECGRHRITIGAPAPPAPRN